MQANGIAISERHVVRYRRERAMLASPNPHVCPRE